MTIEISDIVRDDQIRIHSPPPPPPYCLSPYRYCPNWLPRLFSPGEVGLATLKRVAAIDASLDLDLMIQYLEIHENQEYLVRRIKTLSKGGCMSGFNSVGGDSFKVRF